jgi:hypothetical protein
MTHGPIDWFRRAPVTAAGDIAVIRQKISEREKRSTAERTMSPSDYFRNATFVADVIIDNDRFEVQRLRN